MHIWNKNTTFPIACPKSQLCTPQKI
jgi:hypothetical protein